MTYFFSTSQLVPVRSTRYFIPQMLRDLFLCRCTPRTFDAFESLRLLRLGRTCVCVGGGRYFRTQGSQITWAVKMLLCTQTASFFLTHAELEKKTNRTDDQQQMIPPLGVSVASRWFVHNPQLTSLLVNYC